MKNITFKWANKSIFGKIRPRKPSLCAHKNLLGLMPLNPLYNAMYDIMYDIMYDMMYNFIL